NLELTAGGLNHFSVLLEARYRDSGKDAYPDILEKAPGFFEKAPGYSDILRERKKNPKLTFEESTEQRAALKNMVSEKPWADRGLFRRILEDFELLPITVDSHFGEYIGWAHDVADHKGILDFLELYQDILTTSTHTIEMRLRERIVPIIEGIVTGSGYREEAVNLPNDGLVEELPGFVAVEVPCRVDSAGIHGEKLPTLPKGYAALLRNYTGVYDLTAEAVLTKSRKAVVQALLVNPVVSKADGVRELVDLMIDKQSAWLGYL
ncbi:MAG: alpha-glucosidase, partial [Spirochaetales bacterium]|nr:alpha-glucosidase [Spirochaetales bacterium]